MFTAADLAKAKEAGLLCTFCNERLAEPKSDYCRKCEAILKQDRLREEALEMEKDGILTEEDELHGSNTGC